MAQETLTGKFCPRCHHLAINWDSIKRIFICHNCVTRWSWDEYFKELTDYRLPLTDYTINKMLDDKKRQI